MTYHAKKQVLRAERGGLVFLLQETLQGGLDSAQQVVEAIEGGELGIVRLDLVRGAEQKARLAVADHIQIVVAVAGSDGLKSHGLQRPDGRKLGMRAAHFDAAEHPVPVDLERIAEDRRPAELFHERLRKFFKCVADDDGLRLRAQLVQKVLCAGQRVDLRDHVLNLLQAQPVLAQDVHAPAHELVIIRLVARGAAQLRDPADLRKRDPDLRYQYSFYVQACNIHCYNPLSCAARLVCRRGFVFFHSITLPHYIIESISLQIKITFYFFIRIYLSKITFFLQNRCFLQIHIFIYMFFDY